MNEKKKYKEYIKEFYRGNKFYFVLGIMVAAVGSCIQAYLARLCQQYLDIGQESEMKSLVVLIIKSVVFVVSAFIILYLDKKARFTFARNAIGRYRDKAFEDITKKSIGEFGADSSGNYISALTNDISSIESNYLLNTFDLVEMVFTFVISFGMMLWYSWTMTIAVAILCCVPIIVSLILGDRMTAQEKAISDKNTNFVSLVKDLLTGFSVIKSFKAEKEALELYSGSNLDLEDVRCKKQLTKGMIGIITGISNFAVQIGIFGFGAYLVIKGNTTAGVVFAFVQLMGCVLEPLSQLPVLVSSRKAAKGLIEKLAEYVSDETKEGGEEKLTGIDGGIKFENVSFAYEEGNDILKNINLNLEKGKSYAIVGGSGSGKSTLLNLMMGSYDNYKGSIKLDGKELSDVDKNTIFDIVSVIQQNVFIFDDTIRRNITMFKDFPDDKVEDAIKKSGLAALIEDKSQDYKCGENGKNLSGGERQRISIARSLLKEAKVLLVDEATAALDAKTSKSVVDSILAIEDITKVVITHKLDESELSKYDSIIVLKNGNVVEEGNFDNLIEDKKYFYSLYNVNKDVA
ncbi:MAG: ABC transporter ATP-binding protein [Lachnospiraceae bacterium]|nr:ABC transporter ATP-binding protein [Lachnospiraceae bacterium]